MTAPSWDALSAEAQAWYNDSVRLYQAHNNPATSRNFPTWRRARHVPPSQWCRPTPIPPAPVEEEDPGRGGAVPQSRRKTIEVEEEEAPVEEEEIEVEEEAPSRGRGAVRGGRTAGGGGGSDCRRPCQARSAEASPPKQPVRKPPPAVKTPSKGRRSSQGQGQATECRDHAARRSRQRPVPRPSSSGCC